MTGRENSEDKFAQQWREALGGWAAKPPTGVWKGIDNQLAYEQLQAYKSKVVVYRWVAAAAIVLSMSLALLHYFDRQPTILLTSAAIEVDAPYKWNVGTVEIHDGQSDQDRFHFQMPTANDQMGFSYIASEDQEQPGIDKGISRLPMAMHRVDALTHHPEVSIASTHEDKLIYYLPVYPRGKKGKHLQYWAGIDVGSGSFNPNYSSAVTSLSSNLGTVNSAMFSEASTNAFDTEAPELRENMSSGETVSFGLNFGMKLGSRWRLHSGMQYARTDAPTETNILVRTQTLQEGIPVTGQSKDIPALARLVADESTVNYDLTDVDMNNAFEFASVPVRAGYVVVDQRLSVEVNAGVVTNIYLGNRLTSSDPDVATLSIGPGDTSPYKDVSFSGLAGLQLGYRVGKKVDVILEPNYRHAINSLTKSSSDFTTNPSGFGLMTGLRYNFD